MRWVQPQPPCAVIHNAACSCHPIHARHLPALSVLAIHSHRGHTPDLLDYIAINEDVNGHWIRTLAGYFHLFAAFALATAIYAMAVSSVAIILGQRLAIQATAHLAASHEANVAELTRKFQTVLAALLISIVSVVASSASPRLARARPACVRPARACPLHLTGTKHGHCDTKRPTLPQHAIGINPRRTLLTLTTPRPRSSPSRPLLTLLLTTRAGAICALWVRPVHIVGANIALTASGLSLISLPLIIYSILTLNHRLNDGTPEPAVLELRREGGGAEERFSALGRLLYSLGIRYRDQKEGCGARGWRVHIHVSAQIANASMPDNAHIRLPLCPLLPSPCAQPSLSCPLGSTPPDPARN